MWNIFSFRENRKKQKCEFNEPIQFRTEKAAHNSFDPQSEHKTPEKMNRNGTENTKNIIHLYDS